MDKKQPKSYAEMLRINLNLTLQQTVDEVNKRTTEKISIDMLVRFENRKTNLSFEHLYALKNLYGCSLDMLIGEPTPDLEEFSVKNNWEIISESERIIRDYVEINKLFDCTPEHYNMLKKLIKSTTRKPVIAVVGQPDAGKTALIIELTGKGYFKSAPQPLTSAIIHIRHIKDKPAFMKHSTVLVLSADVSKKLDDSGLYSPELADDENYCMSHLKACGDYALLNKFGVHSKDNDNSKEIGAVIVYLDSPILNNCDLVDLPGFDSLGVFSPYTTNDNEYDSRDSIIANKARKFADAFIYISQATQFMYGEDIIMSQAILKSLPPLEKKDENNIKPFGNIFFVASYANAISFGNKQKLKEICDTAATRLWSLIEDHPCISERSNETGYDYNLQTFKDRFFTFDTYEKNVKELSEELMNEIKAFVETQPLSIHQSFKENVSIFCNNIINDCSAEIKKYNYLLNDYQAAKIALEQYSKDDTLNQLKSLRMKMERVIDDIKFETSFAISGIFKQIIDADHILDIIEKYELKKNKRDMERLINILNSQLESKITKILESRTRDVNEKISNYIQDCERITFNSNFSDNLNSASTLFSFNVERAFAGGLSGASVLGALAAWAATCGNLGGYIIIAKAVSALAGIGIHIGGTAAAVSAVSALGGPAVFAITTAIIAGITTLLALGGTWKKSIGNKLVKQYNNKESDKNILNILTKASDKYWEETLTAFKNGADQVEKDWIAGYENVQNIVKNFSVDEAIAVIEKNKQMIDLFNNLRLTLSN